ncbi:MAG: TadE family type IV pilus minor pilin [Gordonia sp. (in: high G+C Gram-positive bacteria)]|uniref:TadE family type IV pilus minor pilin n=1 Tax=Gordonia sp. (in: high G+C Gram-positive bacteria) TaxID=84139 RepID=UPI0039E6AFB5
MVTVEAAYALAGIAAFLVLGLGAVGGVAAHLGCTDAARETARLAALGDRDAIAAGTRTAPSGAHISVRTTGKRVVVEVSARVPLLPIVTVSARSVAAVEPSTADEG